MKPIWIVALAGAVSMAAVTAEARALKLKPAKTQPEAVTEGLSVEYAFPDDVKSLRDAYVALGVGAEQGTPLAGMDYLSSEAAPGALTSGQETKVAARITGYLRFDAPGTYRMETYSNDGLELTIGGREIAKVDEKRGCDPIGEVELRVPEAGWYEVEALYWQRKGGSCLILEWAAEGGELEVVPASAFGH
ncbi:hypothetical protein E4Z66_10525 [Aliishimia ponticola]|uniref:PA14 domain-containing protein n=1 Tax=Aliishimia ponticola TaxID=2499833 RepID=A0A4S4NM84_9RHOB|nr:PA14 domain-containing protein [Aliishimia ponticola]THH37340.1 hypothetical protein E4Z66_10525 [Aliishimia ponticola]